MLKMLRFVSLLLQALNLGLAFAHLVEMSPKRAMGGREWLTMQRIYKNYGKVAAITFPVALLSTLAMLVCVRHRKPVALLSASGPGSKSR